jgi:hypothetical protein
MKTYFQLALLGSIAAASALIASARLPATAQERLADIQPDTGFPAMRDGQYKSKIVCTGYLETTRVKAGSAIFMASNTPPKIRNLMTKTIAANGRYRLVPDSRQADFLIIFGRSSGTEARTTRWKDVEHQKDEAGQDIGEYDVVERESTTYVTIDEARLTIFGVRHPASGKADGIICPLYSEKARKVRGAPGMFQGDPGKRLNSQLKTFLAKPDKKYYPDLSPTEQSQILDLGP